MFRAQDRRERYSCHRSIVSAKAEALVRDEPRPPGYDAGMTEGPYIAEVASLIGDPARANMLAALMDGRAMTAKELGLAARIAPSTASGHLKRLSEGRLLSVTASGRHRYYRLSSPAVAQVLEHLMAIAVDGPPRHRPKSRCDEAMSRARTCYDHLAGRLGVKLAESFAARDQILIGDEAGLVTDAGEAFLGGLGIDVRRLKELRRPLCRLCLDWSERRWHIGGAVGAAIATRFLELGWVARRRYGRALTITPAGEQGFADLFGFEA